MLKITDNIKLGKLVGSSGSTSGSGGSSNYNDLTNKPSINGVSLDGNKTSADLGVLDLNTTTDQIIKSAIGCPGLVVLKDNIPIGAMTIFKNYNGYEQILMCGSDISTSVPLFLIGNEILLAKNPTITNTTTLADLPDNALLTKAQVQEMINNALNNS